MGVWGGCLHVGGPCPGQLVSPQGWWWLTREKRSWYLSYTTERLLLPLPLAAPSLMARMCFESSSLGISLPRGCKHLLMLNGASKPQEAADVYAALASLPCSGDQPFAWAVHVPTLRCPRFPTGSCFWTLCFRSCFFSLHKGWVFPSPFGDLSFETRLCWREHCDAFTVWGPVLHHRAGTATLLVPLHCESFEWGVWGGFSL